MRSATAAFLLAITVVPLGAQQEPAVDTPAPVSSLDLAKTDEIVDLLATTYAASLATETAIRTSACSRPDPRCAPVFLAQDAVLGPWNWIRLLKVVQEAADPNVSAAAVVREYSAPPLPPTSGLPDRVSSLAAYAVEQQAALYGYLEAWQITLDRLNTARASNDDKAVALQRRALDEHAAKASIAAAAVSAASTELLEHLTPLLTPFSALISLEDATATKLQIQESGFAPELKARFAAFGISKADSDLLEGELFALSDDVPLDLVDGLRSVTLSYDRLADLLPNPTEGASNARPLANAGLDQALSAGTADSVPVALNGTGSADPEGGALRYFWSGASVAATGPRPTVVLPRGTHHIALTVVDARGGTDVDLVTITVGEDAAPVIYDVIARLHPSAAGPNQLVPAVLEVSMSGPGDPMAACQVVSVAVNDRGTAAGQSGDGDVVLEGNLRVLLRAGRNYTVTVQCAGASSSTARRSIAVSVPALQQ